MKKYQERVNSLFKTGEKQFNKGQYPAAATSFDQALFLLGLEPAINNDNLNHARIKTALYHGDSLRLCGQFEKATKQYGYALEILGRVKETQDTVILSAKIATSMGNAFYSTGNYTKAIEQYRYALKIYDRNEFRKIETKLNHSRVGVTMSLGNSLSSLEKYGQAAIEFQKALTFLNENDFDKKTDPLHAQLSMNLGVALQFMGEHEQAIKRFNDAWETLSNEYCKNLYDLNTVRALTAMNRGEALESIGEKAKAVESYKAAETIYESMDSINHFLPKNKERCRLYANSSSLLEHIESPLTWARSTSNKLVTLLELAPAPETSCDQESTWESMRNDFTRFHSNYLQFVITNQHFEEVPRILFTIQGRELAAELLDHMDTPDNVNLPKDIKAYQRIRKQLRELSHASTRLKQETHEDKDREKRQELHLQMTAARQTAAKLPEYRLLGIPFEDFSLESIQARNDFSKDQGLLLLISHTNTQGMLLITKQGAPQWIDLPVADRLVEQTIRFTNSLIGNHRQYRRDNNTETFSPDQHLSTEEFNNFWPQMSVEFQTHFWQPLQNKIDSLKELIILPHGSLHLLPLGAGGPSGLKLRFYPGLVYYVLQTFMTTKHKEIKTTCDLGLIHYDYQGDPKRYLPSVGKEISAITSIYKKNKLDCRNLTSPETFPNSPLHINALHFAGHGDRDPRDSHSTAILVSRDQVIGQRDLIDGKARVNHAFINSCTTGTIRENHHGTPISFVTGLLRTGARSVTAALFPIADHLAAIFARVWHQQWINTGQQSPNQTMELSRNAFVKEIWRIMLTKEVDNCDTLCTDIRAQLISFFRLSEEQTTHIDFLINNNINHPERLPLLLTEYLDKMGYFKVDDTKNLSPEIGTILYGMRVYGE